MSKIVNMAEGFARFAHGDQVRPFTGEAYIGHPARVVGILEGFGIQQEDIVCAAWLHDVVEDCDVPREFIDRYFGSYVGALVWELTKPNEPTSKISMVIKAADLLDNVGTIADVAPKDAARAYLAKKAPQVLRISEGLQRFAPGLAEELARAFHRNWTAVTE